MSCLPESGGCERPQTEPFVAHLNRLEGSGFAHEACLDRLHRESPQPETLYFDPNTGGTLVIERKTVVWPPDYVARHRNDHLIAEALSEALCDLAHEAPLSVHLNPAPRRPVSELVSFAREVAESIRSSIDAIRKGRTVGSNRPGRRWRCYLDPEDRAMSDEPLTGLMIRWTGPDEFLPPDHLPSRLIDEIRRVLRKTVEKFRGYHGARGILLLDPYGCIQYTDNRWWSRAFQLAPVPSAIAEVWLATYDWLTDLEEGWIFERVHPRLGGSPS